MPPPIRRSPPVLRSTASADTVLSDLPNQDINCEHTNTPAAHSNLSANAASIDTPQRSGAIRKTPVPKQINTDFSTKPTDTTSKPASTSVDKQPSTPKECASMAEMQKQMLCLKRQLLETQSQLLESRRQFQQMETTSRQSSEQTVSDHNLNLTNMPNITAIDFANTTTLESRNMQATHTSTTSTETMTAMQLPPTAATNVSLTSTQTAPTSFNTYVPLVTNNVMPPYFGNTYSNQQQHLVSNSNVYGTHNRSSEVMLPRKIQDLPEFSGEPEDWPLFYTAYCQSTAAYGYTNFENNQRLQKCLKGEAKGIVMSLLIHPDNVSAVIDQLKFRFGRPEQLIHSQLKQVRELSYISENNLVKIVPFSTKVKNLSVFLKSVNGEQHIANPTLLEELVLKLPMSKRLEWARISMNIKPYPTIEHFSEWLCEVANLICLIQDVNNHESKRRVLHATEKIQQCPVCKGNHKIYDCRKFFSFKVDERWALVKKIRACFSCLNIGHTTRECRKKQICPAVGCQRKHNKLLHDDAHCAPMPQQSSASTEINQSVLSCSNENKKLLFRVLPVTLYGEKCSLDIYALFDDGSSITMLDKEIADQIGVRGRSNNLNIQWFGGRSAKEPSMTFNLRVSGAGKKKNHLLRNVYAISNLNLPMQSLSEDEIKNSFKSSQHHSMKPYSNVVPKLLIGLDHACLGLPSNLKTGNLSGPFACDTELGWVVFGPCKSISPPPKSCLFVHIEEEQGIHKMVEDYFNIESMGVRAAPPVECDDDVRAKQILHDSTKRMGKRFQTGLLWKKDKVELPQSYSMALSRLKGIEQKMQRDVNFSAAYSEVINGYIAKGYVRKVPPEEINTTSDKKWYLPHFGVINPNKEKKKLRLVFDAAAKVNGISLNDNLLKGPQCISSLPSTLYSFRTGRIAVCADICEMFHQILIQPTDRISQRFLWRNGDLSISPNEYEMLVMTFGAACSPCSALHVMKSNAKEHTDCHPRAIEAICEHHYMDDFVDSFDSIEEAVEISKQVKEIHKNGGFDLRGFTSNSNEVITSLDGASSSKIISANDSTEKVLGLYWDSATDTFMFKLKFNKVDQDVISGNKRPTKRQVLSIIMSTFDPLGFLNHYTVGGKLVLRHIWKCDVRWDEPIPDEINTSWEQWRKKLKDISNFRLPRFYFPLGNIKQVQLHIFVDASEEAFAAVAYWRFISTDGAIGVSFVCSKTKCAPLTKVSIPRLELQAAVLGTRIKVNVLHEHKTVPEMTFLWSDSKTVLKWISSSHRNYKPYVAHRIAEILESTEAVNWKWIATNDNVADDATRRYNKIDFCMSSRWLNGPKFLKQHENEWPSYAVADPPLEEKDEEEIRPKFSLFIAKNNFINIERFSCYSRLKRSIAQMFRFINKCRKKCDDLERHGLTAHDLDNAEKVLCQQVQRESFSEDIKCIENRQPVPKANNLANLMPYIAEDGLLRVYGRIDAASCLPYSMRRPIILPKEHYFTKLIVMYYHREMKHQNHEATICKIREKFWIPQLRRLLRNIVSNCFMCRRNNATPAAPIMGPLPIDRLEPYIAPFKYTGLDYFGPLNVTIGRRTEKRWVALFTCLTIRAIHLEVAHDLSTDSCIIAMKNFINRRGVPVRIRSDNGKNFVGANEEAKRFEEVFEAERIQSELSTRGVEWVFNCPANPSEGGVWERMVQCVKRVLRQTMKDVSPKEHVLQSLLIEAENIVNSRPLTHLPISPHEEEPLTPNHFLLGSPNAALTPVISVPDDKLFSIKKQWRVVKSLRDRFWKRWVLEYLPTLTRRVKWCEHTKPMKEGDVVFVCDPNLPRNQWRRGLVTGLHTGSDGIVRRADVKTASGVLQRAVSKLAVLDLVDGEADRSTGVGVLQNALL